MSSPWEFVLVAVVVTITPGPATATIVRVAARHGRRAATSAIMGNSVGVLVWGVFSALGVSSLILASQVTYDLLRVGGVAVLVVLGIRSLMARGTRALPEIDTRTPSGWRVGLVTSLSNPKLAVFFVALFPQFLSRGAPVLPYALGMAAVIVAFDLVWYSALVYAVDRARGALQPRVQRRLERLTGAVLIGLGVRLAAESR
jgi:threonine/homoserine/homoserine lactone efflux protein